MPITTALIDSVPNSRTTIRGHLNAFPELSCHSFAQPEVFIKQCYHEQFELVICNYEFDSGKNSALVLCELQQSELLNNSCGKFIITSDTSPNAISQILDIDPDLILMRPYQIGHLEKGIRHYLQWREILSPYFTLLDQEQYDQLIPILAKLKEAHPKFANEINKLNARVYLLMQDYAMATQLYQQVLKHNPNTLWARWGLLKSQFMSGAWSQCKRILNSLLEANIIRDKAYEWLACVAYAENEYAAAEAHLNRIRSTELSMAGTKLKVQLLCLQKRIDEAIAFLDRKRKANTMLKEQFKELTYEMAKCYMLLAETHPKDKSTACEQVKLLVTQAGKQANDNVSKQRRDALLAQVYAATGDTEAATNILAQEWMKDLSKAPVETLQAAMKSFTDIGQTQTAQELYTICQRKTLQIRSPIDNVMQTSRVEQLEEAIFDKEERAKKANKMGNQHYAEADYSKAMHYFYKARNLYPKVPAFSLNLLTCLHHCQQEGYRECSNVALIKELSALSLSRDMQTRLEKITRSYAHA